MLCRFALVFSTVVLLAGCGSEEPLQSTRPADTGYVVTEVAVVDTGTAVVDSAMGDATADTTVDDTGSAPDTDRDSD